MSAWENLTEKGELLKRISKLESDNSLLNKNCLDMAQKVQSLAADKAELQRVVQVKDEALNWISIRGNQSGVIPCPQDYSYYVKPIQVKAEQALDLTPKDLPALIPEEEYLRVKQELVDLSRSHTVTALGKCIEKFELLKSHAEAMADSLYDYVDSDHILQSYRKDFPK